jgi:hypothetical protein
MSLPDKRSIASEAGLRDSVRRWSSSGKGVRPGSCGKSKSPLVFSMTSRPRDRQPTTRAETSQKARSSVHPLPERLTPHDPSGTGHLAGCHACIHSSANSMRKRGKTTSSVFNNLPKAGRMLWKAGLSYPRHCRAGRSSHKFILSVLVLLLNCIQGAEEPVAAAAHCNRPICKRARGRISTPRLHP